MLIRRFYDRLNYAQRMNLFIVLVFLFALFCGMAIGISIYRNELVTALQECLGRNMITEGGYL